MVKKSTRKPSAASRKAPKPYKPSTGRQMVEMHNKQYKGTAK